MKLNIALAQRQSYNANALPETFPKLLDKLFKKGLIKNYKGDLLGGYTLRMAGGPTKGVGVVAARRGGYAIDAYSKDGDYYIEFLKDNIAKTDEEFVKAMEYLVNNLKTIRDIKADGKAIVAAFKSLGVTLRADDDTVPSEYLVEGWTYGPEQGLAYIMRDRFENWAFNVYKTNVRSLAGRKTIATMRDRKDAVEIATAFMKKLKSTGIAGTTAGNKAISAQIAKLESERDSLVAGYEEKIAKLRSALNKAR